MKFSYVLFNKKKQIFPIELKSNIEMKPVQYLSRCSFRFRYNQTKFLCISSQKNVVGEEATVSTKKNTFKVREEAIWTITKISSTLYSYFELEPSKFSISPFPYVQSITVLFFDLNKIFTSNTQKMG